MILRNDPKQENKEIPEQDDEEIPEQDDEEIPEQNDNDNDDAIQQFMDTLYLMYVISFFLYVYFLTIIWQAFFFKKIHSQWGYMDA